MSDEPEEPIDYLVEARIEIGWPHHTAAMAYALISIAQDLREMNERERAKEAG